MRKWIHLMIGCIPIALACPAAPAAIRVVLLADSRLDAPADYGLEKLRVSLAAKGIPVERATNLSASGADFVVLAGQSSSARVAGALKAAKASLPQGAQALAIRRATFQGRPALVLCGSDARGLMYAALDTADRVSWAGNPSDPFSEVRDTSETPYLLERGISIYTMQRAYFESRLYDETYWKRYFDMLARRPDQRLHGHLRLRKRRIHGAAVSLLLRRRRISRSRAWWESPATSRRATWPRSRPMIRMAHERGIELTAGIWDHIYRGGVQGGGIPGRVATRRQARAGPGVGRDRRKPGDIHQSRAAAVPGGLPRSGRHPVPHARRVGPEARRDGGLLARSVLHAGATNPESAARSAGQRTAGRGHRGRLESGPERPNQHQVLDGADGTALSPHAHQSPEPEGPPARVRRPAALSAALPRALALWNGGTTRAAAVGRPRLRAALRRERAPVRRRQLRGQRNARHQDARRTAR